MEASNTGLGSKCGRNVALKLHKNRRINNKWGIQYHVAVQDAVFGKQCLSYMPTEPPASLSEEIVESDPLYVCKQCKDCFRFQSSFEDHNKRRSWILGLLCHNCFVTVCTHLSERHTTCPICIKKDNDKRSYLRTRGLTKNQKYGAVKVFYNQCQLFEHIRMHGLNSVDMGDVMLMPLPADMSNNDWSPELEIICEALMEHTFLLRMHIIDWLKLNKIENNWWKLVNNTKNNTSLIGKLVNGYQGRQLFQSAEKLTLNRFIDLSSSNKHTIRKSSDIEFTDTDFKDKNKKGHCSNMISDKNISENEDNPCMSTDIAFIDCGPTLRGFEPELSMGYASRKGVTVVRKSTQITSNWRLTAALKTNNKKKVAVLKSLSRDKTDTINGNTVTVKPIEESKNFIVKQSVKNFSQKDKTIESFSKESTSNSISKSVTKTGVSKVLNNSAKIDVSLSAKKFKLHKTTSDYLEQDIQSSIAKGNSKVLTIQSPKNTDITSIISQLPSHLISTKKLVFIEKDTYNINNHNKKETEKKLNKSVLDNSNKDTNTISQKKICDPITVKKQQVSGKIVIKNGKKYIIKHAGNIKNLMKKSSDPRITSETLKAIKRTTSEYKTSSIPSNESENISMEQVALSHNDISLLTPSPSPSELSSSSSCESQVKQSLITSTLRKAPPHLISICSQTQNRHLIETISFIKEKNGEIYMNVNLSEGALLKEDSKDMCEEILKYRQKMMDEFHQLNSFQLKERIDHLQYVSEEMIKVMNFISDNVLKEKMRSINTLQHILEECFHKSNRDIQEKKDSDTLLNEWESHFKKTDIPYKCSSCNKIVKPKSYIAGFSKLPQNDNVYCPCYKYVCHECLSYQGSLSRFITHQNFHKKSKPFICPDCHCKFTSAKFLEVHTWTVCFHMLKRHVFACKICEIDGFRDMESITRHFAIMHSDRKIACEDCFKVLLSYSEYIKHYTEIHSSVLKQNPTRLAICRLNNDIIRVENYMSYLERCPAIRKLIWFKCPFCPLITLENKHLMAVLNAHLRDQHLHRLSEIISKEALTDIFGAEFLEIGINASSEVSTNTFLNADDSLYQDGTIVPKIVDTRTITSEIFERCSQDTYDTWSMNSDNPISSTVTSLSTQITKRVNSREEIDSEISKDLDVKYVTRLKSTEFQTTTKASVVANDKSTSQCEIVENVNTNRNPSHENTKETTIESHHDNGQKTKEAEETDKLHNDTIAISKSERPAIKTKNIQEISSFESNTTVSNPESPSKADGRIKVIDIRKICNPDIEPLVAETFDTHIGDGIKDYTAPVLKPPPLARIPQHLLVPARKAKKLHELKKSKKSPNKPKCRIAINGPIDKEEKYVDYICHLCSEKINTSEFVVQSHFHEKHSSEYRIMTISPRLLRLSSDFINGGYKQLLNSRKRKSDNILFASKRKRRWTFKKPTETKDINLPGAGLCVEQETAEDEEGNFKCKKCGQRCIDMSNLREHIATTHRLKGRYLICLECGENFVVAPSLQMHLKAFHGIEDPISYMNENPSYAPDINDDLGEGRTTVANQCYVCMAVFESKAAVDKHLRVHGMAFLNRKRIEAKNALQSPEKKTNTEEDKQKSIKCSINEPIKRNKPAETILEKINAAI